MILTAKSILKYSVITILSIGFIIYLYAQSITYIRGPFLEIKEPHDGTNSNTQSIILSGTTKRISFVLLNGVNIYVNEQGEFNEKLLLSPGYNIIEIKVIDRFKRELTKQLHITYYNENADDPPLDTVIESIKELQRNNVASSTTLPIAE